ncbi:MAG: ABC transporter substrate-binding protein [Haloarculaceae archaeon]
MSGSPGPAAVSRRGVLASLATGGAVLGGGCMRRLRTMTGWESSTPVALRIKTVPADADPYALEIARSVAGWFRTAGIETRVLPMAAEELHRQVLLNNEFDLFVARVPGEFRSPDALYSLLHSRFVESPGWQNPFGFTNLDVDEFLERQRRSGGDRRREAVTRLQETIARTQPFTVLAFPDDVRAARTTNYTNWRAAELRSSVGYLLLERLQGPGTGGTTDGSGTPSGGVLRVVTTDRRATENLNPLAVEFRRSGVLTGLLYDSLGYTSRGGTVEPWLADSWAFTRGDGGPRARVRLRAGLAWHDGEPLTAEDVTFTHRFLADTSLGADGPTPDGAGSEDPIPAPRFQGRNGLVAETRTVDDRTVEFRFVDRVAPRVATRAFTLPVLPKHVWADRTSPASVGGIEFGPATEALVTTNIPPVGSGPLRFVRNTPREALVLERFDDHFLTRDDPDGPLSWLAPAPAFERLRVRVVGSDVTAVEMVAADEADVTGTTVGTGTVPRIGRADDLDLLVDRSEEPFVVGYNTRRPPLTNPRFRATLAQLIDQASVAETVFEGYAEPAASPLAGTDWLPSDLRWDGSNPVTPFLGRDGELDVARARNAFREIGYQYDDGTLLEGN